MDTPTKKHGWRNQPLPRLAIIVLAALIVYLMILKTENNPKFYPAKGEFIQSPRSLSREIKLVEWKIPSSCKFNELVYSPKTITKLGRIWRGLQDNRQHLHLLHQH